MMSPHGRSAHRRVKALSWAEVKGGLEDEGRVLSYAAGGLFSSSQLVIL